MGEALSGELVEGNVAIVPAERGGNLFATQTGAELVVQATERATALADVVRKQKLSVNISGREHVKVEGWTLLGSMLGVFPVTSAVRELRDSDGGLLGFEARVEARTLDGHVVGAAISRCMKEERNWGERDDYALLSMAQTRATSKALRMPLGFVMSLAGFDPTPADEVPAVSTTTKPEAKKADKPKADPWAATKKAAEEADISPEAGARIVAFHFDGRKPADLEPADIKLVAGYVKAYGKQKARVTDAVSKLEKPEGVPPDLNMLAPDELEQLADRLQAELAK